MPQLKLATFVYAFILLSSFLFAETQYPLTLKDSLGNELTFTEQPSRISSKTMFTDEVLLSLIDPQSLTSLTNFADDPNYSNILDRLPDTIPLMDLNIEAIIHNAPDVVFAANWSDAGKINQLRALGTAVYLVDTPQTLDQIQTEISTIGLILNVSERANELIVEMNDRLNALADTVSSIKQQEWVALDYNSWGTSSGVNSTWQAVLDAAGILNGAAQFEQGSYGQVPMSKELIVEVDPDILFLPSGAMNNDETQHSLYHDVLMDPALANVKAIKNKRIYAVPENLRGTYSQYLIDTVEYVVKTVHHAID